MRGWELSPAQVQAVALIAALASDAELLLLDEPTSGLDPLMEEVFRACIADERRQGRTVLLSSHLLHEVEVLCDRVTIIRAGKTVESGSLAALRHLTRTALSVELAAPPVGLADLPGVHDVRIDGARVRLEVDPDALDAVMRALTAIGLRSLVSQPPTLEELFLRHYAVAR
jgi:ABC-2 type transport system ATP-binding protein